MLFERTKKTRSAYDARVLKRIEKVLDVLIPIAGITAMGIAGFVFFNVPDNPFVYFDLFFATCMAVLFLLRKILPTKIKIAVIAALTLLLGEAIILFRGFTGNSILMFVLSSLLVVGFLSLYSGILFSFVSVLLLPIVPIATRLGFIDFKGYYDPELIDPIEWLVQVMLFALFEVVLIVIINVIKVNLALSVQETEKHMERIVDMAYHDQLTGLPNRAKFIASMTEAAKKRGWLVLFDVRGFSLVNSIHGNTMGDKLLKVIADCIQANRRGNEYVARTGSNEFGWYSEDISETELIARANLFAGHVYEKLLEIEFPRIILFNTGFVYMNQETDSAETSIQKAYIAMELAKSKGVSYMMRYDALAEEAFRKNETIINLLEPAIQNKEFFMCYQEKISHKINKTIGVEALARWNCNPYGSVSPVVFIPLIEKSSLNNAFGNMVIDLVFNDIPQLLKKYGEDISVSINISPAHFLSFSFIENLVNTAENKGISPSTIILEVTEETMIDNTEEMILVISKLRKAGFKIALDDFGTGYSSLSYLALLDVDELKIDRSFVFRLGEDPKIEALIRSIISLKEAYQFSIVAEGVETQEQCAILNRLGCDIYQGFLFSKPIPIGEPVQHRDFPTHR